MSPLPSAASSSWRERCTGWPAVLLVLFGFWVLLQASLWHKTITADEIGHIPSGYTYWLYGDYRLNPESGNLPQRFMALPFLFVHEKFPAKTDEAWRQSDQWSLGYEWFFQMGNDADAMLRLGRAASGLFAVAFAALVWFWARELFGPVGGMVSLLLCVLDPTVLANGALMISDMACAFFFLAALGCLWSLLHRLTLPRLALSSLVLGGLFLAKMSAVLILPLALVLTAARLIGGRPLPVGLVRPRRELRRRSRQALAFAAAAAVHTAVVVAMVWGFYGFRYSMLAPGTSPGEHILHSWEYLLEQTNPFELLQRVNLTPGQRAEIEARFRDLPPADLGWSNDVMDRLPAVERGVLTPEQARRFAALASAPPPDAEAKLIDWLRRSHWLPEAYVYGYANTWKYSRHRAAFFNGRFGHSGWKGFFPYTFLVKTPLTFLAVIVLAVAALIARWRAAGGRGAALLRAAYLGLPLASFFCLYWWVLIHSHLNIGHRHLLPTYGPLCILGGAAALWPGGGRAARRAGIALGLLLLGLGTEVAYRFPNYIAYFNGVVRPAEAWRHLVDSSLDWGQDLPDLARYIARRHPSGPLYLAYFGSGSPDYYRLPVRYLHSNPGWDVPEPLQTVEIPRGGFRAVLARHPDCDLIRGSLAASPDGGDLYILLKKASALRLSGGTYFISATMLQSVERADTNSPFGHWNPRYEAAYQEARAQVAPLLEDADSVRLAALTGRKLSDWSYLLDRFTTLRFARLAAYLRQREPDDTVDFSILVYRLTDADIAAALDGPPAETGPDVLETLDSR